MTNSPRDMVYPLTRSLTRALAKTPGGDGGSSDPVPQEFVEYTSEASSSPSTTAITIGSGNDAIRIYVGGFNAYDRDYLKYDQVILHVKNKTQDTTTQIAADRYTSHQLEATAGDEFAIGATYERTGGTADIPVWLTDGQFDRTATAPTATTGNANSDKATPSIWSPSNAHLTLTDFNSQIAFTSPAADRWVWVREYDGSAWGPPRQVLLLTGQQVVYRATHKQIALLTLDGSAVPVAIDGTISGASNEFAVPWSGGATLSVSSSSDGFGGDQGTAGQNLEYAIANASDGDTILLTETTTYTLSALLGDDYGSKDLRIMADTGVTPTLAGKGGNFDLGAGNLWLLQGLTWDLSSAASGDGGASGFIQQNAGMIYMVDCTVTANSAVAKSLLRVEAGTMVHYDCTMTTSGADILSSKDSGCAIITHLGTYGNQGVGASDNITTTHLGGINIHHGTTFTKTNTSVPINPDTNAASEIYLFYCTVQKGAGSIDMILGSGATSGVSGAYGCFMELGSGNYVEEFLSVCKITATYGANNSLLLCSNNARYRANRITGGGASSNKRAIDPTGSCRICNNLIYSARDAVFFGRNLTGATWSLENNTFDDSNYRNLNFSTNVLGTFTMKNNAIEAGQNAQVWVAPTATAFTTTGNINESAFDADYKTLNGGSLGTGDVESTAPNLSSYLPQSSDTDGTYNCDNEGTAYSYVGDLGWNGIALLNDSTPRGAAGVPLRNIDTATYDGMVYNA